MTSLRKRLGPLAKLAELQQLVVVNFDRLSYEQSDAVMKAIGAESDSMLMRFGLSGESPLVHETIRDVLLSDVDWAEAMSRHAERRAAEPKGSGDPPDADYEGSGCADILGARDGT